MKREDIRKRSELRRLVKEIERAMKIVRQQLKAKGERDALVNYNLENARKLRSVLMRSRLGIRDNDMYEIEEGLRILSKVQLTIDIIIQK